MSDINNLDSFMDSIKESEYKMNKELKEKILNKTLEKISSAGKENGEDSTGADSSIGSLQAIQSKKFTVPAGKNNAGSQFGKVKRISSLSLRNIAAALLTILLISAFIPNSPINALYQKTLSFIPGIGVVQSENEEDLIKGALNEPVKVMDGDEFLEVKAAYIANNALNISIVTNIGTSQIKNIEDKEEVLRYVSGETMPGIYLQFDGQKLKLQNFSTSGPSLETKAYKITGAFPINENTPVDALFGISLDGFSKSADIRLSPVKNGVTPEAMGSTITVNDIMVFANTDRNDGILTLDLSTVAPSRYRGVRFDTFDFEKPLFPDSLYILDKDGNEYKPDGELKKQNDGGYNSFYFRIPDEKVVTKIVIPQILYSRDYNSEIKIYMPAADKEININKEFQLGTSELKLEKASIIPKNDSLLPEEFKKFDCLKIDYGINYKNGVNENNSNEKVLRMIPDILVPETISGYITPSSSVYSELIPLDKNEGSAITVFDNMDSTKKIKINFGIEFAAIGPFEMEIRN